MLYCSTLINPKDNIYNIDDYNQISIDFNKIQELLNTIQNQYYS